MNIKENAIDKLVYISEMMGQNTEIVKTSMLELNAISRENLVISSQKSNILEAMVNAAERQTEEMRGIKEALIDLKTVLEKEEKSSNTTGFSTFSF